jgi:hypothetical protein
MDDTEMNDTEPTAYAFPFGTADQVLRPGMTLRDYAAIHLKVPSSGTDWLDEMITESLRNELAAKAMQAVILHPQGPVWMWEAVSKDAYEITDAMLKAKKV